jgi:hypothetical protein
MENIERDAYMTQPTPLNQSFGIADEMVRQMEEEYLDFSGGQGMDETEQHVVDVPSDSNLDPHEDLKTSTDEQSEEDDNRRAASIGHESGASDELEVEHDLLSDEDLSESFNQVLDKYQEQQQVSSFIAQMEFELKVGFQEETYDSLEALPPTVPNTKRTNKSQVGRTFPFPSP